MLTNPFLQNLKQKVEERGNFVCVGLDPNFDLMPDHFDKSCAGAADFLQTVIEETKDLCVAFKPNMAYFEAMGIEGLRLLEKCRSWIPTDVPMILDAKRADVGHTSKMLAKMAFDIFGADAITLHPLMGFDSIEPFLAYRDKFNFLLALTSNPGAKDFEKQSMQSGIPLYLDIAKRAQQWNADYGNIGLVVGATHDELKLLRKDISDLLFLVPGVGAQGGDYHSVVEAGCNLDNLVLINMSRSIIYCTKEADFNTKIREEVQKYSRY